MSLTKFRDQAAMDPQTTCFPQDLCLDGKAVSSMEEVLEVLRGYNKGDAYVLATQLLDGLMERHGYVEQLVCMLFEFVDEEELWCGQEDHAEFRRRWQEAIRIQERRQEDQAYIESMRQKAAALWGERYTNSFFGYLPTRSMAEQVSKFVTAKIDYLSMRLAINNEIIRRLSDRRKGVRKQKSVMQGDIRNAYHRRSAQPLTQESMRELGLQLDDGGYCCKDGTGHDLPTIPQQECQPKELATEDDEVIADADTNDTADADADANTESDDEFDAAEEEDSLFVSQTLMPWQPAPQCEPENNECGCQLYQTTIDNILKTSEKSSIREKLIGLRKIGRAVDHKFTEETICVAHAKRIVEMLGMRSQSKNHWALMGRISYVYGCMDHWDNLTKDHASWFAFRPKCEDDPEVLGSYRYPCRPDVPMVADFQNLPWLSFESLCRRLLPDPLTFSPADVYRQMLEQGSIVIPQLFGWLKEDFDGAHPGGIMPLIHEEFDIYEHHYMPRSGKPRLGWLRNMWHSLVQ